VRFSPRTTLTARATRRPTPKPNAIRDAGIAITRRTIATMIAVRKRRP
jgi:hypothetical protein